MKKKQNSGEDGISTLICTVKFDLAKSINVPYSRYSSFSKPYFPLCYTKTPGQFPIYKALSLSHVSDSRTSKGNIN